VAGTDDAMIRMSPRSEPSTQEVLAGLVERVTYHKLSILPCSDELREKRHSRQSPRNRRNRATGKKKPLQAMTMTVARTVATRLQTIATGCTVANRLQDPLQPSSL
jgi:hypothetical protein